MNKNIIILFSIIFLVLYKLFPESYGILGVGLFIFHAINLLYVFDKKIAFVEFIISLSILQWILGAVFYYKLNSSSIFFVDANKMLRNPTDYFDYIFPATNFFIIGLTLFNINKRNYDKLLHRIRELSINNLMFGKIIFVIGFFITIGFSYLPSSLKFVGFVFRNLFLVGSLMHLLSYLKTKDFKDLIFVLFYIGFSVFNALRIGMFGGVLFSLIFSILLIAPYFKVSAFRKIVIVSASVLFIATIQIVKPLIRSETWFVKDKKSNTEIFLNIVKSDNFSTDFLLSEEFLTYNLIRFNQGGLISNVMEYVPRRTEFAKGETIFSSIVGIFIPRIIWPSKPISGQRLVSEYTKLNLAKGVSMGVTPIGEAYLNFGKLGGILFMLFAGMITSIILRLFAFFEINYFKGIFLWTPVCMLNLAKVETDFSRTIGYGFKVIIVLIIIHFIMSRMIKKL